MAVDVLNAVVVQKTQLTQDVFDLILKTEKPFPFQAGQFAAIRFPTEKPPFHRAYSIACRSHPEPHTVQICIKRIDGGPASTYICALQEGDEVELKGPSGKFLANQTGVKRYYFVTTGTGVAPLKAMIEDILLTQKNTTTPLFLVFGFRSERDMFYVEYFEALKKAYSNFDFVVTLSQPSPAWKGLKGRVTHYLQAYLTDPLHNHYYICGVGEMVKDVRTYLTSLGVPKEQIHYERYT